MTDAQWMRHALALGRRGLGNVWPNPAVGCVLVREGRVIGRGWTRPGGRPHAETEALAAAGALAHVAGHRHRAHWTLLGVERARGDDLLDEAPTPEPETLELPFPTEGEDVVEDYRSLGLTLGRHPLALLRPRLAARRLTDSDAWRRTAADGDPVRIAGLVTMRQRPGSAKGTMFVTLEDERGTVDVILWPDVVERFRREAIGARLLAVSGATQRGAGRPSLLARRLEDLSGLLGEIPGIGAGRPAGAASDDPGGSR